MRPRTASSAAPPAGVGLGIRRHALPVHRRTRVPGPEPAPPTAQIRPAEAATPSRTAAPPGLKLGTRCQAVPVQCRISVPAPNPTAQASRAEIAASPEKPSLGGLVTSFHAVPFHPFDQARGGTTSESRADRPSAARCCRDGGQVAAVRRGRATGTCFQAMPFHRRIKVLPPRDAWPTAQAFRREVAATAERKSATRRGGAGHALPGPAIPVHDQGSVADGADGPGVPGGRGCNTGQDASGGE